MGDSMKQPIKLKVKSSFVKNFKDGYPLVTEDSVQNHQDLKIEGSVFELVDEQQKFISKGYYGKQNKGRGWVLTKNRDVEFNLAFFTGK